MSDVRVIHGDMREQLLALQAEGVRVHSVVTDPPYHLQSIVKRFGAPDAAPAQIGATGAYARASRGFMGKQWDGGDIAFQPETWRLCYDLLPPGGHLLAFAGTRTYHRMACAIEDAGFELRDTIAWLYGSGFPKSHNVSKGIDKRRDWQALAQLHNAIRAARTSLGISQSEAARRCGLIGPDESLGGGGFMWFETGMRMPTRDQWPWLRAALSLGDEFDACFEEAEREVTGTIEAWENRTNFAMTTKDGLRRDNAATDAARQWDGWGSALKPAMELVCVARKPLIGTIAANVLAHGTGALNIDGCRVAIEDREAYEANAAGRLERLKQSGQNVYSGAITHHGKPSTGRWPANVVTDDSDEVVKAFPDSDHARGNTSPTKREQSNGVTGWGIGDDGPTFPGDSGSAARFFYSARPDDEKRFHYSSKADADDRLQSRHPTVKPVSLLRWLVRLVTPPGGTVLDCFAGSGTTGMACMAEGLGCILVEREHEYYEDILKRLAHVRGDDTPLFSYRASPEPQPDLAPLFDGMESKALRDSTDD